jgi:hypothetical protein
MRGKVEVGSMGGHFEGLDEADTMVERRREGGREGGKEGGGVPSSVS